MRLLSTRLQVSFQMVVHQAPLMNNTQQKTLLSGSNIIQEICYLDCYLDCGQLSSIAVSVILDLHVQLSGIEYRLGVVKLPSMASCFFVNFTSAK